MGAGELVRAALESLNTDVEGYFSRLADDVTHEPFGLVGIDAVRLGDGQFLGFFAKHHRVVEGLIEDGDRVYVWLRFTGTRPDGAVFEFETNNHYVVRDGRIASMTLFVSPEALGAAFAWSCTWRRADQASRQTEGAVPTSAMGTV